MHLAVAGVRPFLSDKFDITKHKNYKYLADSDKKNTFDIEKYMNRKLSLPVDAPFETFEYDGDQEEQTEESA